MKNFKKILACLMTATMVAGLSAISVNAAATRYEAEEATLASDPEREAAGEQIRISGNLVGWVGKGNTITLEVNAETAGKYNLTITHNDLIRNIDVTVNDAEAVVVACTGNTSSSIEVELVAGKNTVVLGNAADWAPDIDYIEVAPAAASDETAKDETAKDETAKDETTNDTSKEENKTPAKTGDAALVAVAAAVVAMAGVAVVSKKRNIAE